MRRLKLRNWLAIGAVPAVGIAMALPAASVGAATPAHAATVVAAVHAAVVLPRAVGATSRVLVFLKDDQKGMSPRSATLAGALRSEEAPFISALTASGATGIKTMSSLPIVFASVTKAQQAALSANKLVTAVIPDSNLPQLTPEVTNATAAAAAGPAVRTSATKPAATKAVAPASICGTHANPEVDPEAVNVINAPAANSFGYDGAGVTVAYIAGPIDTTIADFQRNPAYGTGGSPVITAVDFTGDPASAENEAAGESFLDASSIAAQPNTIYNLNTFVNETHTLNGGAACDITLRGAAPGADILGENVFSAVNDTTESNFIQAIDYAVHYGVKVLNESFGANNFPDTALDATRIADDDAVALGVTVVVSSGDAGITSTIGSPATDPLLIAAGATTTFRGYQQDTYGGINATTPNATNGNWTDDNISSLSSGGFAMDGKTVDIVAPGDLNWAECSTNAPFAAGCATDTTAGTPDGLELSGGTSEAAPLTSAAAADVIEAYAKTHNGSDPSPALVKQILMSTATDISAPADQQGAGLLNVLAAVKEAVSIKGTSATRQGGLQISPNQIDIQQDPGASTRKTISVTNTGAGAVTVNLSTRALTKQVKVDSGSFCLNPSLTGTQNCPATTNTFFSSTGGLEVYQEETFSVPATTSRLNFTADYPDTGQTSVLHVALFDPTGTYAGYSLPQGFADYANTQVANPVAGTWTAVFYTLQDNAATSTVGTSGTIQWDAVNSEFQPAGSISPSSLALAAGATGTATFTATSPATSGDAAQSIVVSSGGVTNTIPVAVRTLVPVGPNGANFSGILTGGNGRAGAPAQTNTYVFNVPKGLRDLDVSAAFADEGDALNGFLVDPDGQTVANSSSITLDPKGNVIATGALNLYKTDPMAGTWQFIMYWFNPVSGSELSLPFNGAIRFNQVSVTSNLPKSPYAVLQPGKKYTFDVTIKNTGLSPQAYFLDPRTSGTQTIRLPDLNGSDQGMTLPLPAGTTFPLYDVPTETSEIESSLTGTVPVTYDEEWFTGDPDISPALAAPGVKESQSGHSASLDFSAPEVPQGLWLLNPSEIGPYANGQPTATASASFSATTQRFDSTVTPSVEDMWSPSGFGPYPNGLGPPSPNFTPVYIEPGKTATIPLTIKPTGAAGTHVSGTIYVDDVFQANLLIGLPYLSADELAGVPFSYRVASPLQGYWITGRDGGIFHFGYGHFYGSASGKTSSPVVGMSATPDNSGYYLVSAAGTVFAFGDAGYHGSLGSAPSVPIAAIATDHTGLGYWLVDEQGHVTKFGDAVNYGSENFAALHETAVGIAATPDGHGYWIVTSDGNVIPFGDAKFHGSPLNEGLHLAAPIVGIASTLDGNGYWLVGSDGGIFAYGDAKFHGSMYGRHLNGPAVGIAIPQSGNGYWVIAEDGGVFTFGGAKFFGSLGASSVSGRTGGASSNS